MTIELLYMPGCRNHKRALERIQRVLRSQALDASIQEISVSDESAALNLRFPGSPTVRVNGLDVQGDSKGIALACRLYTAGDGAPSEESLRRALSAAGEVHAGMILGRDEGVR